MGTRKIASIRGAAAWVDRVGLVSAADLTAAIGVPRRDAAAALDRLVEEGKARSYDGGGYALWTAA